MAENKIPTILIGLTALLLLVGMFLPVSKTSQDFLDLCSTAPDVSESDCEDDATLDEVIDDSEDIIAAADVVGIEITDPAISQTWLILGLILAIVAIVLLEVPALSDFEKFGGIAGIVSGIFGLLLVLNLNSYDSDITEELTGGTDFTDPDIGFWLFVAGTATAFIGGLWSAYENFMGGSEGSA